MQVASANTDKGRLQSNPTIFHLRDVQLIYTNILCGVEAHGFHLVVATHLEIRTESVDEI